MKILFDFFPVILFFIAYKMQEDPIQGILVATAVAIAASFAQIGLHWWRHRRLEKMHVISLAIIVVLGGATLLFQDEMFIKWKPTAINWLFGLVFLASQFIGARSLVRRMMEPNIQLPEPVWLRLNLSWVGFFFVAGVANLYVVYNFDTDTWVNFKLFGLLGMTLVFVLVQAVYLARHIKTDDESEESA